MESILRAVAVYAFLLIVFRAMGKRSLSQITMFDFVLLLIISEAVQNAMIADDYSLTNSFLVVLALVGMDLGLSFLKSWSPRVDRWVEDLPLVLVEDGRPLRDRMKSVRVDDDDVLEEARRLQGLERMDQIKYAVLERSGGISIIPKRQ